MGINIWKWLFGKEISPKKIDSKAVYFELANEIMIREMAFNMIVNKIANAITKCDINVYEKGKRVKNDEWFRWNVSPNKNQSKVVFFTKLITLLYNHNEALVVPNNNELYVADSFNTNDTSAFFEHTFSNIQINDLILQKTYRMSEVYYFKLNDENIKRYINGTLTLYGGLINAAYSSYLVANGNKGILKIDQYAEQADDFQSYFNDLINDDFKKFFSNPNAVLPLFEGYEYEQLSNAGTQSTTRDFKALIDDVISLTANALNVPISIANGTVQDTSKAIDELLTFCIDPLIEMLTNEMNRKTFIKDDIKNGCYFKFNTLAIKHIDLLDVATSIDKLISSGFTCINDLREVCNMDIIDEEWANQFFMTKNYSTIEELMKSLKGGEGHEETVLSNE